MATKKKATKKRQTKYEVAFEKESMVRDLRRAELRLSGVPDGPFMDAVVSLQDTLDQTREFLLTQTDQLKQLIDSIKERRYSGDQALIRRAIQKKQNVLIKKAKK